MASIDTVVGAALVLAAQLVMHSVTNTSRRKDVRRERIEGIAKSIFEDSRWLEKDKDMKVFDVKNDDYRDHFAEARVLQELYVVELNQIMLQYYAVAQEHYRLLHIYFDKMAEKPPGTAKHSLWDNKKYLEEFYGPHLQARNALINKCRELIEVDEAPLHRIWYERVRALFRGGEA